MGLFDKMKDLEKSAEDLATAHPDQVKAGLAKLGNVVDQETGGRHHDQIAKAERQAADHLGTPGQAPTPPDQPAPSDEEARP